MLREYKPTLYSRKNFLVFLVDIDAADALDDPQPDAQSTVIGAKIALDAFFDFDLHV